MVVVEVEGKGENGRVWEGVEGKGCGSGIDERKGRREGKGIKGKGCSSGGGGGKRGEVEGRGLREIVSGKKKRRGKEDKGKGVKEKVWRKGDGEKEVVEEGVKGKGSCKEGRKGSE